MTDGQRQDETAMKAVEKTAVAPIRLSVIVPTRNEANNVAPLLQGLAEALADTAVEIIFVDDSSDETPQVIAQNQSQFDFPIRLLARPPAEQDGLSGAVVAGLRAARGTWVCVMDADLQHPPAVLPQLLQRARQTGADMVVGSRRGAGMGPLGLSRRRALTSQGLTILARMLFPRLLKNVSDPLTGLFLARRQAVDVARLRPDGFKILLEILVRCPDMRVTEIHFDFAPRHDGRSKADFQEGLRFFRHLLRLRLTAEFWFARYVTARTLGLGLNLLLLAALVAGLNLHYLPAAVLAMEITALANFAGTEFWVFRDWDRRQRGQRLAKFMGVNQLFVLLRLPLIYGLVEGPGLHYVPAVLLAIFGVGLVKYGASEQWIWNKGLSWQRPFFYYDLHGIVRLASQVRLPELAFFETAVTPDRIDIELRLDRHGTPSAQPGAIAYHERLGRFGFGVAIMPGDVTEIVVSPALEKSPYALYKNVLEPVLRWAFVRAGYALVYGACVAFDGRGTLVVPDVDRGKTTTVLRAVTQGGGAFLSDDYVILGRDGRLFAYPKPVTVTSRVLRTATATQTVPWRERVKLRLQNLLFSQTGRQIGLWLSQRRLPVATLNILVQRLLSPPKRLLPSLMPDVTLARTAVLTELVLIEAGPDGQEPLSDTAAAHILQAKSQAAQGFPPYSLLVEALSRWHNEDWPAAERAIIAQALRGRAARRIRSSSHNWWPALEGQVASGKLQVAGRRG